MYRSTLDRIGSVIGRLEGCRSAIASVGLLLDGDVGGDLDEEEADALAAPMISQEASSCRRALCDLKEEIEASSGSEKISYEGEKGFEPDFEHCNLDSILTDARDALHDLVSDYMCAEKDLLEALAILTKLEGHLEHLEAERPGPILRDIADDPDVALDELSERIEKALGRPLHEFGIESSATLSGRIEEAARDGDWSQWRIMRAFAEHPNAVFFNVDRCPIEPVLTKAELVVSVLSEEALGKSLAEVAVEEARR